MPVEQAKCAGCGKLKRQGSGPYDTRELVEVEVWAGQYALVCRGRGRGEASDDCVRRARHGHCPCCGEEIGYQSGITNPVLCTDCRSLLERGREARAESERQDRRWVAIDASSFFGEYVPGGFYREGERSVAQRLVAVFVRMVGGRTESLPGEPFWGYLPPHQSNFSPHVDAEVECTEAQFQALSEVSAIFGELLDHVKREAHKAGGDLLGKLHRGETTIADYDDEAAKRGPRKEVEE